VGEIGGVGKRSESMGGIVDGRGGGGGGQGRGSGDGRGRGGRSHVGHEQHMIKNVSILDGGGKGRVLSTSSPLVGIGHISCVHSQIRGRSEGIRNKGGRAIRNLFLTALLLLAPLALLLRPLRLLASVKQQAACFAAAAAALGK